MTMPPHVLYVQGCHNMKNDNNIQQSLRFPSLKLTCVSFYMLFVHWPFLGFNLCNVIFCIFTRQQVSMSTRHLVCSFDKFWGAENILWLQFAVICCSSAFLHVNYRWITLQNICSTVEMLNLSAPLMNKSNSYYRSHYGQV